MSFLGGDITYYVLIIYDMRNKTRQNKKHKRRNFTRRKGGNNSPNIQALINSYITLNRYVTHAEIRTILNIAKSKFDVCDYKLLNTIFKIIQQVFNIPKRNLEFYVESLYINEFPIMKIYFEHIQQYFDQKYNVFSLGDSLDKLNEFWNLMNPDRDIINIPFSGSMFTDNLNLVPSKQHSMFQNFREMLENNPNFAVLVNMLNSGQNVVITDYINSGKSFFTLLELFNQFGIATDKLIFEYITFNDELNVDDFLQRSSAEYNYFRKIRLIYVPEDSIILSRYFTNSEDFDSRCVPKYLVNSWSEPIAKIQKTYGQSKYAMCNLHRILFACACLCFYNQTFLEF